jgi:nucleoside-diphosphate-sugar epimerase
MKCLIVGCGYVGLPLGAELVRQGHEVFGLRRSAAAASEMKSAGIQPLVGDVTRLETLAEISAKHPNRTERGALLRAKRPQTARSNAPRSTSQQVLQRSLAKLPRQFDWVVNCVAAGGSADNYRQIYLEGNRNLISWLAESPPEKFIYTSSTSVYGQNDGSLVTEQSPARPVADTAKVLVETEQLLLAAQKEIPAVILRVAGIYGPERGHWFRQFLRGEARIEGDGSRYLNMIHRDDVVGCIIAVLEKGRAGEIYNAVDDEPVCQIDFFRWLAATLGGPLPPSVSEDGGTIRKRGATNKRVSNRKLKSEFGYRFKYPDFRSGYGAELSRLDRAGK